MSGSMRFGSVCSGIEAASVAWGTLGWRAAWLSEIEPFPCAVLAHHYPDVPNLGDMTTLPDRIRSGEAEAPDVFCGGTPCQAFSVAGLRKSLDDARGNLSLTFCEIADAIDQVRLIQQSHPSIVFWENVPGVLNTKDNAFGCFLGALAGEDDALIPPGGRWTNAGFIDGPQRAVAWRVLDAQYFGVAQRRKRVFVVASARADFDPAAVLFEFEGVRRDIAPSRETGQRIAPCVTNGPPFSRTGNERVEVEAMVAVRMVAFGEYVDDGTASAMKARDYKDATDLVAQPLSYDMKQHHNPQPSDTVQLTTSNCATVRGDTPLVQPIPLNSMNCFRSPDADPATGCGIGEAGEAMFTITKGDHHAVAQPMVALPIALAENTIGRQPQNGGNGNGFTVGGPMYTLNATGIHGVAQPIPIDTMNMTPGHSSGGLGFGQPGDPSFTLTKGHSHAVAQPIAFHPTQDPITSTDGTTHGLGCGSSGGQASIAVAQPFQQIADCLTSAYGTKWNGNASATNGSLFVSQPIAFEPRKMKRLGYGVDGSGIAPVLRAEAGDNQLAVAYNIAPGKGDLKDDIHVTDAYISKTIDASGSNPAMHQGGSAIVQPVGVDSYNLCETGNLTQTLKSPQGGVTESIGAVRVGMAVRRLTPVECERLQGFPDNYTNIPWRKATESPDGPRYKALGNSWAVPVVRWIGERIARAT